MIPISTRTQIAAAEIVKKPNLVIVIDGAPFIYGSAPTLRIIKIGDPGLVIGGGWKIGSTTPVENSNVLLSLGGSSQSINQQLDADKGRGSSIQSIDIELVDKDQEITKLITPGFYMSDILGRKAKIYLALNADEALWPEDYLLLFRGIVDDIKSQPASVTLTVSHPEQKKKQVMYPKVETNLNGAISDSATTITLDTTAGLLLPVAGPDGVTDHTFKCYVRIGDEIIRYTGISGNQITGCTRGQLSTFAAAHADDAEVSSFYRLQGTAMDVALKMMLSMQDFYMENVPITSFQLMPGPVSVANAIFFKGINVTTEYGITIGDYFSTTGAGNGANNVALKEIVAIEETEYGSYIVADGVTFVDEDGTPATIAFRSKYDSWPAGLQLGADEVDVTQHEYLRRQYLSSFNYDFYIKDTLENARDFLDTQVYRPASAYSVPRKAQASVQMLIGPIPGSRVTTLSEENIIKPSQIKLRRSINKNFFNTIVYKYEEDELEDKLLKGKVTVDATSLSQIDIGTRALVIEAKGLRETDLGGALAISASNRRLDRYAFGAEYIEGLQATFGAGFDVELGDVVIVDLSALNVSNTTDGSRDKPPALFEVQNKKMNYKTGEITFDLVDTAFDENARYALIGPASVVKSGVSSSQFVIEPSYSQLYGAAEYQKWSRFSGCVVTVRSPDGTTRYAQTVLQRPTSNTVSVSPVLPFVPQPGDIMELAPYAQSTAQIKLIYGFMSPLSGGDPDYLML